MLYTKSGYAKLKGVKPQHITNIRHKLKMETKSIEGTDIVKEMIVDCEENDLLFLRPSKNRGKNRI